MLTAKELLISKNFLKAKGYNFFNLGDFWHSTDHCFASEDEECSNIMTDKMQIFAKIIILKIYQAIKILNNKEHKNN